MPIEIETSLDYLIPELRMSLGDIDSTQYRYLDSWLRVALFASIKALQRWWRIRYTVDEVLYTVSRYPTSIFTADAPPVIEYDDETPILLMAKILIKSGVLQNSSWTTGSWKDAEISVSNIAGGSMRDKSLQMDWDWLLMYLKPPQKRLGVPTRDEIPGANEY